jgi:hypothetical protein
MVVWLLLQYGAMLLLSRLLASRLDAAFTDGFIYRGTIAVWFFAGAPYPGELASHPAHILEVIGVILGSLATAGLVGTWFLVRLVNQAAYATGILMASLSNPAHSLFVIPYWTLLRAAGYAGLILLCAQPFLTSNWSPGYYWQNQRRLILISVALVVIGLAFELFLPGIIARLPFH